MFMFQYSPGNTVNNATGFYISAIFGYGFAGYKKVV